MAPAGVCGGPIAALLGSDLPTLRNPAPAIGVIAATESEFDPLHPPDQPASASVTPRHGRSCFAADRPLVALHQDQEASTQRQDRLHRKDRDDLLQSLASLAAHSNRSCLLRSGASPLCSAAMVQPVAVTTTFMLVGLRSASTSESCRAAALPPPRCCVRHLGGGGEAGGEGSRLPIPRSGA